HPPARRTEVFREAAAAILGDGGGLLRVWIERVDIETLDSGSGVCLSAHGVRLDATSLWWRRRPGRRTGAGGKPVLRGHIASESSRCRLHILADRSGVRLYARAEFRGGRPGRAPLDAARLARSGARDPQ